MTGRSNAVLAGIVRLRSAANALRAGADVDTVDQVAQTFQHAGIISPLTRRGRSLKELLCNLLYFL
jgi:hypothetical protein